MGYQLEESFQKKLNKCTVVKSKQNIEYLHLAMQQLIKAQNMAEKKLINLVQGRVLCKD